MFHKDVVNQQYTTLSALRRQLNKNAKEFGYIVWSSYLCT